MPIPQARLPFVPPEGADEHDRQRWLALVRRELPAAATRRGDWPIRRDHCFARVILDAVCRRPWREAIAAPAWRRMDVATLREAIALAEAILAGTADLHALDAASLAMRGERRGPPPGGCGQAVDADRCIGRPIGT